MPERGLKHLILGGARSGKSRYAETRALAAVGVERWIYVATSDFAAGDAEMHARIAHHRASRDARWQTVEEPVQLAAVLAAHDSATSCVLVDCLTLWLNNCLAAGSWAAEREALIEAVAAYRGRLYCVSNEVGSGVVPLGSLSRQFVDESGRLHQNLAASCNRVTLVAAGLPLTLKDNTA